MLRHCGLVQYIALGVGRGRRSQSQFVANKVKCPNTSDQGCPNECVCVCVRARACVCVCVCVKNCSFKRQTKARRTREGRAGQNASRGSLLSLRATHGKLTSKAGTWVGTLTYSRCPREGNLTEPPTSDAKKYPRGGNLTQKCCSR